MSYNGLVSQLLCDKRRNKYKSIVFCYLLNNIGFHVKGMLKVLFPCYDAAFAKIHRYVAAS
jgi:hypothetical protein